MTMDMLIAVVMTVYSLIILIAIPVSIIHITRINKKYKMILSYINDILENNTNTKVIESVENSQQPIVGASLNKKMGELNSVIVDAIMADVLKNVDNMEDDNGEEHQN